MSNHIAGKVHTRRVGLHHSGGAIDVHHQSGQEIALTMDKTEGIVVFSLQAQRLSHTVSVSQSLLIEGLINRCVVKGEHSHCDAANL